MFTFQAVTMESSVLYKCTLCEGMFASMQDVEQHICQQPEQQFSEQQNVVKQEETPESEQLQQHEDFFVYKQEESEQYGEQNVPQIQETFLQQPVECKEEFSAELKEEENEETLEVYKCSGCEGLYNDIDLFNSHMCPATHSVLQVAPIDQNTHMLQEQNGEYMYNQAEQQQQQTSGGQIYNTQGQQLVVASSSSVSEPLLMPFESNELAGQVLTLTEAESDTTQILHFSDNQQQAAQTLSFTGPNGEQTLSLTGPNGELHVVSMDDQAAGQQVRCQSEKLIIRFIKFILY